MTQPHIIIRSMLAAVIAIFACPRQASAAGDRPFVDFGRPESFVKVGAHAIIGNSFITQNYKSCFPEISELTVAPGWSTGVGAVAEFGVRDYLWFGTGVDFIINNYTDDIIINRDGATSVSNVFLRNHFYALNFPLYVSFKFNIAPTVRWNVDGGIYYSYGVGGSQKQTVYTARINEIGQLITNNYNIKTSYYNDDRAFLNSAFRSDIGLHYATGVTFSGRITIGFRGKIGFKNLANTLGEIHPNVHNVQFLGTLGYWF